jgi:hypothetical protein
MNIEQRVTTMRLIDFYAALRHCSSDQFSNPGCRGTGTEEKESLVGERLRAEAQHTEYSRKPDRFIVWSFTAPGL